jgi:hypothetical protein
MIPAHWKNEFQKSIKSLDTEEKLDLYFYRPLGFVIAKVAFRLNLTPTQLTLIGLALGIGSGFFLYRIEDPLALLLGSTLFVLAGIFDSSDGQLARLGGKSTKFGLVLDGVCDNIVFGSAYVAGVLAMAPIWGHWALWPVALLAGLCHSLQSSMLDFYNREYLVFGLGKEAYWNPTWNEQKLEASASNRSGWIASLRSSWIWQQQLLTTRTDRQRLAWRELSQRKDGLGPEFRRRYRAQQLSQLRLWRLMGANFHTICLILFFFLGRFDLYLVLVDIIGLTIALLLLRWRQSRIDQSLLLSAD